MKKIAFKSKTTQKIYEQYLQRVSKASNILSMTDRADILMEINSHIYEAMEHKQAGKEEDNLLQVIESLGEPREFLKPQIAEKKLKQATSTFNPIHVFQALLLNIRNGFAYIFVAFLYLLLFSFVFIFFAKLWDPESVGLFMKDGYVEVLGYTSAPTATEVMGYWLLPLLIIMIVVLHFINTLILKWISK